MPRPIPAASPRKTRILSAGSALLLAFTTVGCATSGRSDAPSQAGTVNRVTLNDRGAQGKIPGNIQDVNAHAEQVFQNLGIQLTGSELKNSGDERELVGQAGAEDVTITLTTGDDNLVHVEAVAKNGPTSFDKDYAKTVVSQIIAAG